MSHARLRSRSHCRAGVARLDVIVIGSLTLTLILGLGIPALLSQVHAARKMQCKNNLQQWGLALHNYHDTFRCFPPYAGGTLENGERLSGAVMLLPYLGLDPLWKQIAATPGQGGDPLHLALAPTPTGEFAVFLCPASTVSAQVDGQQHLSYVFCAGDLIDYGSGVEDFPNQEKTRGAFGWRHCRTVAEIVDGTSNTAFMAERDLGNLRKPRNVLGRAATVAATSPAVCLAMTAKGEYLATTSVVKELMGERWSSGHPYYSIFLTAVPPNGPSCAASTPPSGKSVGGWFTASSHHQGGCHVLMGDGTVRFVNEKIDTGNLNATQSGKGPSTSDFGAWGTSYGIWGMIGTIAADKFECWGNIGSRSIPVATNASSERTLERNDHASVLRDDVGIRNVVARPIVASVGPSDSANGDLQANQIED